ncbi:hypothetical protein PVX_001640 [Plasmodium vivax]|uniref:VIR protein n=1 Tax=Plasmodium vivax (strain Salvador I) TaxID=126793 RepID=A5KC96_PLAVS|nr:hypothetical protein PVX_001640 [Plasmodium vivax]EDL42960.1 hypothetical protein PVX_001640 [Plasmodium vivax]|eukprot:XP_001612687.1 hypothetical protein [Plasmodium vivax Sal-1]
MAKTNEQQLEETISSLELDKTYKDFFANDGKSKNFDSKCTVFDGGSKKNPKARELCSNLVYYLEKIREMSTQQESNKYCGYLPYWLYDKIGKIHSPPTTKIDKVSFYEDLIKAGNEISGGKLKHACTVPKLKDVDLNELKKRKISYIYFKNLENIYNISNSKNKDNCAKYLKYLESFKISCLGCKTVKTEKILIQNFRLPLHRELLAVEQELQRDQQVQEVHLNKQV